MKRIYWAFFAVFTIAACGGSPFAPRMSSVMDSCDNGSSFSEYVKCIKTNYSRKPNHRDVKAFYAELDAINEDVARGALSETKAKAAAYASFNRTVESGNRARYANMQRARLNDCLITGYCY